MIYILLVLTCLGQSKRFIQQKVEQLSSHHGVSEPVYNETLAKSMYHYTQIATCTLQTIRDWKCGYYCDKHPGMVDIEANYNSDHASQTLCGYNTIENLIILAYRSTQEPKNALMDVYFQKTQISFGNCYDCKVHTGFLLSYEDLREEILQCATKLKTKYPQGKFMIVGHSLGGAIAPLVAIGVTQLGYKVDYLFTYGAPRLGNVEFVGYFQQYVNPTEHWRITHYNDWVPHMPPPLTGYLHIPQEIWYNRHNTKFIKCNDQFQEDEDCSNGQIIKASTLDHVSYFNETQLCRTPFNPNE